MRQRDFDGTGVGGGVLDEYLARLGSGRWIRTNAQMERRPRPEISFYREPCPVDLT